MDRQEVILALIRAGHSQNKALEIAIDAERGIAHAKSWVKIVTGNVEKETNDDC